MKILAIKMNKEPLSTKVIYEKNGSLFIRTGADGFTKGTPLKAPLKSALNKWGFRSVVNPPEFRDSDELIDNIGKFDMASDGKIKFYE